MEAGSDSCSFGLPNRSSDADLVWLHGVDRVQEPDHRKTRDGQTGDRRTAAGALAATAATARHRAAQTVLAPTQDVLEIRRVVVAGARSLRSLPQGPPPPPPFQPPFPV